jgi:hypothetical protein
VAFKSFQPRKTSGVALEGNNRSPTGFSIQDPFLNPRRAARQPY